MSALKTKEITEDIEVFLTDKAMEALQLPTVLNTSGVLNGTPYVVKYLGIVTNTRVLGAIGISQILNNLVNEYEPLGVLAKPLQLQIGGVNLAPLKVVTIVYLAFSEKDSEKIDQSIYSVQEGGMPKAEFHETAETKELALKAGLRDLDLEPI